METQSMQRLDLNGQWQIHRKGSKQKIPAAVPGCVHLALHEAGLIDDPVRTADDQAFRWIEQAQWTWKRRFDLPDGLAEHDRVELVFDGIDTVGQVWLNGKQLGTANNMFRCWRWEVKRLLKRRDNRIEVRCEPVAQTVAAHQAAGTGSDYDKLRRSLVYDRPWLRKMQCNFGWDWGPRRLTYGLWQPVQLEGFNQARLDETHVRQRHGRGGVDLSIAVAARRAGRSSRPLRARVVVQHGGRTVDQTVTELASGRGEARLTVRQPKLWWPAGMGDQPLYQVTVELINRAGDVLDQTTRTIGLRTIDLQREPDADGLGESFGFAVNGRPFFAKGANWIPAHLFPSALTAADYDQLLAAAARANMNMIRIWGGGIYEQDAFYDACDRLGLLVWQDFMFACARYPGFDRQWLANVKAEAAEQVRRLRHHACLALWCGNNECEKPDRLAGRWQVFKTRFSNCKMAWSDYLRLNDQLLGDVVAEHDPDRTYWPASPHTPTDDLAKREDSGIADRGDAHVWGPWFSGQTIEAAVTSRHRFVSETGFQALPHRRTIDPLVEPENRNLTSPALEDRQKCDDGNPIIAQQMARYFRMPVDWPSTVYLSQVLQTLVMESQIEHWRRNMHRTRGVLYWQLNDCWPGVTWASLDYDRRPKAMHYRIRHAFAPVMISSTIDEHGDVQPVVVSDGSTRMNATVCWSVYHLDGRRLDRGSVNRRISPDRATALARLPWSKWVDRHGAEKLAGWLTCRVGRSTVSRHLVRWVAPKALALEDAGLTSSSAVAADGSISLTLKVRRPALWQAIDLAGADAHFQDNFFHLMPGDTRCIRIEPVDRPSGDPFIDPPLLFRNLRESYEL